MSLVNARFVRPIDENVLFELNKNHKYLFTMEENIENGGFGSKILKIANSLNLDMQIVNIALPNIYVEHGNVGILKKETGIDAASIYKRVLEVIK